MFVHAGASLHGHEYSAPGPKRNSLLRSALGSPVQRSSTPPVPSTSTFASPVASLAKKKSRPFSDSFLSTFTARATSYPAVEDGTAHVEPSAPEMKEHVADHSDSDACASDSDLSRAAGSSRKARKQLPRSSTNYALAQPAPKLGNKQRIIHTKPQLITQLQLLTPGGRPRPVIDAYPSSAFAKTIMAPLLMRVPRIAGIKTELSVRDIMLVKSQDYAAAANDTDSDVDDDDNMRARDLVAILSPLRTDDRAEIVMADGTVWIASPRNVANSGIGSYDFVSVDENGATTTARWARRRCGTKQASPLEPSPPLLEYQYTFSIIDPQCRRHPIMAAMTTTSLKIFDTYTTTSSSASRHSSTSPVFASPSSSVSSGREDKASRHVVNVQEWQKNFIAVSAVWVALRASLSADSKQAESSSAFSAPSSPVVAGSPTRILSSTSTPGLGIRKSHTSATIARSASPARLSVLPKRAMSTGAAFMQRRRAILRADSGSSEDADGAARDKRGHRTLSGNWTGNMASGLGATSLAGVALAEVVDDQESASIMTPVGLAAPANGESQQNNTTARKVDRGNTAATGEVAEHKTRRPKWKCITAWFAKIRTR